MYMTTRKDFWVLNLSYKTITNRLTLTYKQSNTFTMMDYLSKVSIRATKSPRCSHNSVIITARNALIGQGHKSEKTLSCSHMTYPTFLQHIQSFVNYTWMLRYDAPVGDSTNQLIWSFIVAVLSLGAWAGAIHSGSLPVTHGRWDTHTDRHTYARTHTHTHTHTYIRAFFYLNIIPMELNRAVNK